MKIARIIVKLRRFTGKTPSRAKPVRIARPVPGGPPPGRADFERAARCAANA